MFPLCIDSILLGEKAWLLDPCYHKSVLFQTRESSGARVCWLSAIIVSPVIFSCGIIFLINILWLSLSFPTSFGLMSVLSDISIAIPACFQIPFSWNIIFHPFTWVCVSLLSELSFCYTSNSWNISFNQFSQSGLLMGELNIFTFGLLLRDMSLLLFSSS
jgi:hypothetical protein